MILSFSASALNTEQIRKIRLRIRSSLFSFSENYCLLSADWRGGASSAEGPQLQGSWKWDAAAREIEPCAGHSARGAHLRKVD